MMANPAQRISRGTAALAILVALVLASCSSGSADAGTESAENSASITPSTTAAAAQASGGDAEADATTTAPPTSLPATTSTTTTTIPLSAVDANDALGRGINLGNSLEAPREGDWGVGLDASYFRVIADAGFDHVRLPVSWAGYAAKDAPFTIPDGVDPSITHPDYDNIWERVDWAVEQALANDLRIIVNMHHYDGAHADPVGSRDRMVAMWAQISTRYANAPDEVYFELFNEPHRQYNQQPELWNALIVDLLEVIRPENPTRKVLIGPVGFNHINRLGDLEVPEDPYLIGTVHLYEPFDFTHQGAGWVSPTPPTGTGWAENGVALPDGVADWSWDTTSTIEDGALVLEFDRQWAGYSLNWDRGIALNSVELEAAGSTALRVGCRVPGQDIVEVALVELESELDTRNVDLSSCPAQTTGIALMNATESLDPVRVETLRVCSDDRGCELTFEPEGEELRRWVQRAAEWGRQQGLPMHLGEFGAFSASGAAPFEDRVAWTSVVADEARVQGMSFAYWEFHSGYGAFDPVTNEWIEPLRDALLE